MATTPAPRARPHVTVKEFTRQLAESLGRNQPFDLAAQLAYFAILSLFPFAMFVLTIVGYLPLHGLDAHIVGAIYNSHADRRRPAVRVDPRRNRRQAARLASRCRRCSFALWTASGGASGLITALNRAYDVAETRPAWKLKLRLLAVTLGGVMTIIIATAAMLIGPEIMRRIWGFFGFGGAFDWLWAIRAGRWRC